MSPDTFLIAEEQKELSLAEVKSVGNRGKLREGNRRGKGKREGDRH